MARILNPGPSQTVIEYVYDGNRLIEERDGSNNVIASYVYGPGIDEPIVMTRGSNTYYYHQDDLGNVVALTDGNDGLTEGDVVERYDYGAFGAPTIYEADGTTPRTASIAENPYLFTGREWNPELNAYWYRTRYYDPTAGRFLSRDTIGLWGDPANLGNPYTYVNNNPWSMADPYGEGPLTWLLANDYGASDWTTAGGIAEASGLGLKGLFWTGPKNTVVGIGTAVAHPIETGKGVLNFGVAVVDDPGAVGGAIWNDIKTIPQDPERIGSAIFDVASSIATGASLKAASLPSRVASIAKAGKKIIPARKAGQMLRADWKLPAKGNIFDDWTPSYWGGGRQGGKITQRLNTQIADWLEADGYVVIGGGGRLPEVYLPGTRRGVRGGNYTDITVMRDGQIFHINTISTLADGVTPTVPERVAASKIRSKLAENEHLILVPKPKWRPR